MSGPTSESDDSGQPQEARQLAELVRSARDGDREALEALLVRLQRDVYPLALRMTANEADAEDASQEILIKIMTRLDSFRGEASVRTWAYRIAVNHLLDHRKSRVEALELDFERFGADLLDGLEAEPRDVDPLLAVAVKRGCTLAMLTCLDRSHRAAYILGEIFGVSGREAAELLGVDYAAFRQQLSRSRRRLRAFTDEYCGLVNTTAPCRCDRRVRQALTLGRVEAKERGADPAALERAVEEMEQVYDTAALMRWDPETPTPTAVLTSIRALLDQGWPPSFLK